MISDDARTKITKIQDGLKWHVDSVRNDPSLTNEWKLKAIGRHYLDAKREHTQVLERDAMVVQTKQRQLEQGLFGSGLASDSGAAIVSRRDAGDRAAALSSEEEAIALLRRAERSGDEPLARAIAERALDERWADVGNAFMAHRPALSERYEQLWQYHEPSLHEQVMESWATMLIVPDEVAGLSDYRIEGIVESEAGKAATQ